MPWTTKWYESLSCATQISIALERTIEMALPAAFPREAILEIVKGARPNCKRNPALINEAFYSLGIDRYIFTPPTVTEHDHDDKEDVSHQIGPADIKAVENDEALNTKWYESLPRATQIDVALASTIEKALPATLSHNIVLEIVAGARPDCKGNPVLINEAYSSLGVDRYIYVPTTAKGDDDDDDKEGSYHRECMSDSEADRVPSWGAALNGEGCTTDDNWLVPGPQSDYTAIANTMAPSRTVCTKIILQAVTPLTRDMRSAIVAYLGHGQLPHLKDCRASA